MGETTDEVIAGGAGQDEALDSDTQAATEAAQIRSGIEETRSELSGTIDALQQKLDPARIAEQVKVELREKVGEAYEAAKDTVREATIGRVERMAANVTDKISDVSQRAGTAVSETGSSIWQFVQENPLATTLIGVGAGMLLLNAGGSKKTYSRSWDRSDRRPYSYYTGERFGAGERYDTASGRSDTAHGALDTAKEAVTSAASSVKETASHVADATRQQASELSDQARYGARVAGDWFQNTLQENPIALGIAALAGGALLGLAFPSTRVESEYMGEARDQVLDKAKSVARETAEKVQHVAQEAGRTVKEAAEKEGLAAGGNNKPGSSPELPFHDSIKS